MGFIRRRSRVQRRERRDPASSPPRPSSARALAAEAAVLPARGAPRLHAGARHPARRRVSASRACATSRRAAALPGQTCGATDAGICVDPSSSQNDGTPASTVFTAAATIEIARQDPAAPASYHEIATLPTNKFINSTVRAVARFKGKSRGNDYSPGAGALLWWGRPGFSVAAPREAQLYLLTHRLPFKSERGGRARFRPRYFAGLDKKSEPRWTTRESKAVPLALDGVAGGSPHEVLPIPNQMAVSFTGPPLNTWIMIYGGDLADYLLADPANARPGPDPGAVRIRFAEHPWGPWTPPQTLAAPGDPLVAGDPYGPGGFLFHAACQDAPLPLRADRSQPPDRRSSRASASAPRSTSALVCRTS
jgi:hypothetical protein